MWVWKQREFHVAHVCVSLKIIKTESEKFVVQILKSPVIFMYCCNIVNISLLEAKQGKENSRS